MPSGASTQAATAAHDPAAGGESKCSGGRFAHADRRRFALKDRSRRSGSGATTVPPIRLTASIAHAAAVRKRWLQTSGRSIGMVRLPPADRRIDDCLYYTGFDVPEETLFKERPPAQIRDVGANMADSSPRAAGKGPAGGGVILRLRSHQRSRSYGPGCTDRPGLPPTSFVCPTLMGTHLL
jgi:hypothetical protein